MGRSFEEEGTPTSSDISPDCRKMPLHHLRCFGCYASRQIPKEQLKHKLSPRSKPCMMVGYIKDTTKSLGLAPDLVLVEGAMGDGAIIRGTRSRSPLFDWRQSPHGPVDALYSREERRQCAFSRHREVADREKTWEEWVFFCKKCGQLKRMTRRGYFFCPREEKTACNRPCCRRISRWRCRMPKTKYGGNVGSCRVFLQEVRPTEKDD